MAKIVVTGGAGFIGSHIVERLQGAGNDVSVIDDLSSGSKANLKAGTELCENDIRGGEARAFLARKAPDVIVHAAAQMSVRESMKDPRFDADVNICGMLNLLQAFEGRYPYVVFISTGGAIYGDQDVFPAPETHPISPKCAYGLSKRVSEMYLDFFSRELGLAYSVLRLANVYGPRQNPHGEAGVVAIFNQVLLSGKTPVIYGTGQQTRDFVYVGDVVDAVQALCADKIQGTFNIGTGIEVSVNQLYQHIREAVGSDTQAEYAPAKPGEQMRSSIDAALAKKTFGWEPRTTLPAGLSQTAAWFRSNLKK